MRPGSSGLNRDNLVHFLLRGSPNPKEKSPISNRKREIFGSRVRESIQSLCCRRPAGDKRQSPGLSHLIGSIPDRIKKKDTRMGVASCPTGTGIDSIIVLPPSSRRQATVPRTVAFDRFDSRPHKEKGHPDGCPFSLEQGTGIEPAFTAWEAVVLPIYEPCVSGGIIADGNGKCNLFLSNRISSCSAGFPVL